MSTRADAASPAHGPAPKRFGRTSAERRERIRRITHDRLGYDHLRPGQEAAIQSVLAGRDTLAVMPTGAGKSAIYQIAGLQLSGPVVVVSPLLALQRDQLEAIAEHHLGEAAAINSAESTAERKEAVEEVEDRAAKFVFLAPEQFGNEEVLAGLKAARPALFVVDEAHCVSEWGHDFRPDYLRLGGVIDALGHPPVLALTATAAPPVRDEIAARLGMREPNVIVRGFDRPNIWLGVERFEDEHAKRRALVERVREAEKPGIVYAATRKHAEEVAGALRGDGLRAAHYHAGMRAAEREEVQRQFMDDELDVIVATTAFGMGIDKPNVRFVYHYDIADSLDSYYQEIGRAGRDGEPAEAILFYRQADVGLHRFFAGSGAVALDEAEAVAEAVRQADHALDVAALRDETGLSQAKVNAAVARLEDVGAVRVAPGGEVTASERIARHAEMVRAAHEAADEQQRFKQYQRSRIAMMQGYAEDQSCRRAYLLSYFGEEVAATCDTCDACESGTQDASGGATTLEAQAMPECEPFPVGSRVAHTAWGAGTVLRYEGDKLVAVFDSVGYKTLATDLVVRESLLRAEG